jgi:hypothetical protein
MATRSYWGHGVVKHCFGDGTQNCPAGAMTEAHGLACGAREPERGARKPDCGATRFVRGATELSPASAGLAMVRGRAVRATAVAVRSRF